jgi:hypothetical protein
MNDVELRRYKEAAMINSEALKLELVQDIINLPDDLVPLVQDFLAQLNDEAPDDRSIHGGSDEQYTGVETSTGAEHHQSTE